MNTHTIIRHLRIYRRHLIFTMISATQYRLDFFLQLFIDFGYTFWTIFFFYVVYANVDEIGGWSYNEILLLVGFFILYGDILNGLFFILNHNELPKRITNGEIDFILLKPISNLFALTAANVYPTSFLSALTGVYLLAKGWSQLALSISFINIVSALWIFGCAIVIGYSFITLLSSLTFKYINATFLPKLANDIRLQFTSNPASIYRGFLRVLVFTVLPFVFAASIPAETLIEGVSLPYLTLATVLAIVFWVFMKIIWSKMITLYSSASS